jgi:hypothetical protein
MFSELNTHIDEFYLARAEDFPAGAFPFHKLASIIMYSTDIKAKGTTYDDMKNDI